ncbi:hypothetical protein LZ554_004327 [Drepanopeziza brunnea f. sp. 'monogermtubi']|nr:hypothetical protein LZ554_004327 [Drepanopeziza brunnea f. sp. 'monogermtubi']
MELPWTLADDGFYISQQHRFPPGKECVRIRKRTSNVPLIIVTAHTDLAPTILQLAGAETGWDGRGGRGDYQPAGTRLRRVLGPGAPPKARTASRWTMDGREVAYATV